MKKICFVFFLLTGCASLQNAGTAHYSVKPFIVNRNTGEVACCEVTINNGKEISSLIAHIEKKGNDYTVDLNEQGVKAFEGQAIAAGAMKEAIDEAVKSAIAASLAPILPMLVPAAGAALASPGIGAAAVGAGAVMGGENLLK
ncbi:MAG: hypothetical protein ACYC5G_02085 [Candidatus Doudnabacteria bacterium]